VKGRQGVDHKKGSLLEIDHPSESMMLALFNGTDYEEMFLCTLGGAVRGILDLTGRKCADGKRSIDRLSDRNCTLWPPSPRTKRMQGIVD